MTPILRNDADTEAEIERIAKRRERVELRNQRIVGWLIFAAIAALALWLKEQQ